MAAKVVFFSILLFSFQATAGKLDAAREAVHGSDGCSESDDADDDYDYDFGCESCESGGDKSLEDVWWVCLIPPVGVLYCLPKVMIESPGDSPGRREEYQDWIPSAYFVSHPYAGGHRGFLFTTGKLCRGEPVILEDTHAAFSAYDPDAERVKDFPGLSSWSLRFAAEYAYDYDSVHRPNLSASFDSIYRLGLTTRWTHYIEPLAGGETDRLTIGDINVTYRIIHSDTAEIRMGVGYRMMFDGPGTDRAADGDFAHGMNFVYLINIFPANPLVISISGDIGGLGKALYLHARASLGAQLGPIEPYIGYDAVYLDGPAAAVLFQGPVAGLRIWM
jgi:hypothetical protein